MNDQITGEASAGKSQLAIQIAIHVFQNRLFVILQSLLPKDQHGCDGQAMYVYTESSFPYSRLEDEATYFCVLVFITE